MAVAVVVAVVEEVGVAVAAHHLQVGRPLAEDRVARALVDGEAMTLAPRSRARASGSRSRRDEAAEARRRRRRDLDEDDERRRLLVHEAAEALLLQGALARPDAAWRSLSKAVTSSKKMRARCAPEFAAASIRAPTLIARPWWLYWKPGALPEGLELGAQVDRLVEALPEHVGVAGARGEAEELGEGRRRVLDHGPVGGARGVEGDEELPVLDVVAEGRLEELWGKGRGVGGRGGSGAGGGGGGRGGGGEVARRTSWASRWKRAWRATRLERPHV